MKEDPAELQKILETTQAMERESREELTDIESWPQASETDFSEKAITELRDLYTKLEKISKLDRDGYIAQGIFNKMIILPGPAWLVDKPGTLGKKDKATIIRTMKSNVEKMREFMEWLKPNVSYERASKKLKTSPLSTGRLTTGQKPLVPERLLTDYIHLNPLQANLAKT